MIIKQLQEEHREWLVRNFGQGDAHSFLWQFLGITEEVGELAHALLKRDQGIRGTPEEHEAKARDAVGDIFIFLSGFCCRMGWDLDEIITATWDEVKQRDWTKPTTYPKMGPVSGGYELEPLDPQPLEGK